jgi:hypothetical protein
MNTHQPYSSDFDLNYFFNAKNIPNQDLVFETFEYFETGNGKKYFSPIEFLNLLDWHYTFVKDSNEKPIAILNHFNCLTIGKLKVHVLIAFVIKWYGGYPVNNFNPQYNTSLKFLERQYLSYLEDKSERYRTAKLKGLQRDSGLKVAVKRVQSDEYFFLEDLDKLIKNTNRSMVFSELNKALNRSSDSPHDNMAVEQQQLATKELQLFISHSSKDAPIVKAFVDKILKLSLKIESDQIFCTSLDESSIKSGEDFRNAIKQKLQMASLVILIISDNYRKSEVCLNEMGATWVLNNRVVPFIVPPINYESVGFIHEPNQLLKINKKENLLKFIDEEKIENKIVKIGEISRHVDDFIIQMTGLFDNNPIKKIVKQVEKPVNELGLSEGDIIEINSRDGLYLFQNEKLMHIADDSEFSLQVYGLNRKDRKGISHMQAKELLDNQSYIPVLYSCKIIIDTATNKKWLLVNDERRFLPNQIYSILVKREGYKLVSLSHDEVMRIPEGDKLNDVGTNFAHLLA